MTPARADSVHATKGGIKHAPSTAKLPMARKAAESLALFRFHWSEARAPMDFSWLFDDIAEYDHLVRIYAKRSLADAKVLEIGYGARPYRLITLVSMGIDAEGVDAEVPVLRAPVRELAAMYRTNGLERLLKSLVRHTVFDHTKWRRFEAALRDHGVEPIIEPERFRVADAARIDSPPRYDLIISEDVFEHIPAGALRALVPRMAGWLRPGGVAAICPNVFTGITGGHALEWSPASFTWPHHRRRTEPWDHLREGRHQPNTYLNRLSRREYRELFSEHFDVVEETVALPDLGREYLTGRVAEELAGWADEELFSNQVRMVLRPKTSPDAVSGDESGDATAPCASRRLICDG
jgi:hypothetical protein